MKRYGMVIRLKPENAQEYLRLHREPWPEITAMISKCNITNYSIFLRGGYLFGYWEYVGSDYEADMAKMAEDPKTREWWALTDPCQQPIESAEASEWWAEMKEVFHLD